MSLLSFKLRKQVSATSFTLVGNTCKLFTIMLNKAIWDKHSSRVGTLSVVMCLLSTVFYEQAPPRQSHAGEKKGVPQGGSIFTSCLSSKMQFKTLLCFLFPIIFCGVFFTNLDHVSYMTTKSIITLGEATTDGVSGKLFSGEKIRDFQGALLEAQGITRRSRKATNLALRFIEEPAFDCVNWAVCTTIFTPSDSIHEVCQNLRDYCLVIVADKKTPLNFMVRGECTFINLSVKKQEELQMHSTFVSQTPWNHFGRKNLGYLYAIANGAKFIWDFDDDNKILSAEHFLDVANNFQNSLLTVDVNETTLNPYPLFGAETFSWPRGFPLEDIKNPSQQPVKAQLLSTVLKTGERLGVIQALANVDPDVDAIYRLQRKIPFNFVGSRKSDVFVVPHQSFVPWNAQATIFSTRAALWATYLPMSVHGRVSDIWRSYITQRLFQNICMRTAFAMDPLVVQNRNPHSYLADFDAEQDLYYKSGKLIELLSTWTPATNTLDTQMLDLYILLYERDYVGIRDVQMIQLWLEELNVFDYQFPTTCLNTALEDN